ncbi:MAG: SPOR domain-containing protein, partial [Nitratireductor sp.]
AAPAAPVVQNRDGDAASAGTAEEPAAPAQAEADSAPVRVVETTTIRQSGTQKVPDRGPVAPTRPSDQPVEIVGNTAQPNRQTEVTALDTRAPKPGEWSMQIASQPSPEGAQKSYANLSARYGSILKGRGVNIVKADIAGKGTFWRVRIPAGSRAEATRLCEQYKAAGGSCFVAK